MSLTSIASDHVVRYLVWFADAAAVSPGPAAPVQNVGPNYALPACGSYNSGVLVVCADASGNASPTSPFPQSSAFPLVCGSFLDMTRPMQRSVYAGHLTNSCSAKRIRRIFFNLLLAGV